MLLEVEKVEYYLESGGVISYAYSPGSSILDIINSVVTQWCTMSPYRGPSEILIRDSLFLPLHKEMLARRILNPSTVYHGSQMVVMGLRVVPVSDLPWPVFYGSWSEYQNNDVNTLLEKVLTQCA